MAVIKPPFVVPVVEGWQGWTVLGLIGFMLLALVMELAPPYLVMTGTLVVMLALSILDVQAAFHGFADEAMLSVAVLFVVAKGIEQSGGLEYVASVLFRTPDKSKITRPGNSPNKSEGSIVWVLLKFCVPVAMFSSILANIPLVAMMIPPIVQFAKKVNLPPSKMLMPLSYAAQLGGTMTLIGAGTNLVVLSMAAQKLPDLHMTLFEIGIVGAPITVAGILYIIAFSGRLLPDREASQPTTLNAREYNVELAVKATSKMARKPIETSGLGRHPGLNLMAISRESEMIIAPTPDFVLQPNDILHFIGVIDSVLLLVHQNGLILTEDEGRGEVDLNRLKVNQILVEAVIAPGSSMVQQRIVDLQCRTRFNVVVVAIHRHGKRLSSAIGDTRVEPGDCLLMVADGPEFVTKHRNNSHFALVSQLPGFKPINRKKAFIASIFVVAMVVASGVGMKLITAALFSSAGLLLTRCLTPQDAVESIELPVLIMIAAAFGIAEGMVESGAATILAKALMGLAGKSMFGLISCTYVATTFFSLAITNSAAVTIMFPVALAAANHQALDFRPFAYILMMAASAGFMTPTACPTNLMVYTHGSYKFSDYIYYGGPLQLWLLFITVGVTMSAKYWWVWLLGLVALTLAATPLIARHKSTHPIPMAIVPRDVKTSDAEHDCESPGALLNVGNLSSSINMSAPGYDDQKNMSPRTAQSSLPASSFPGSFHSTSSCSSSPFPAPYRLDESSIPTVGFSPSHKIAMSNDSQYQKSLHITPSSSSSHTAPHALVFQHPPPTAQAPITQKTSQELSPLDLRPVVAPFRTRQPLRETSYFEPLTVPSPGQQVQLPSHLERPSSIFQVSGGHNVNGTFDMDAFTEVHISDSPRASDSSLNDDGDFLTALQSPGPGLSTKPPPSSPTYLTAIKSLISPQLRKPTTAPPNILPRSSLPIGSQSSSSQISTTPKPTHSSPSPPPTLPRNSQSSRKLVSAGAFASRTSSTTKPVLEHDLTGGISKLLISRRLSSLKDVNSFADNRISH